MNKLIPIMPRYAEYKDSGVDWLGEIPVGWEAIRMKYLYQDYSKKNHAKAELLSVTQSQGVVPRSWVKNRMVMPSGNLESFKFIEKGDFAISLRSFEGGLEYCHHDGIISPAYTVLKAAHDQLSQAYYKFLFKSFSFISEIQTSIVGIREGKNISFEELSYSLMPLPSLPEQTAIAEFLDDKVAKIDELVGIKRRQIKLLAERKQILIQTAVTKGLNPDAPMKDSGVEWIGEIPAHWRFEPVKYSLHGVIDCEHKTAPFVDDAKFFVVRTTNVKKGSLISSGAKYTNDYGYKEWTKRGVPKPGDVLLTREAPAGEACIIPGDQKICLGQRMVWLKVDNDKLLSKLLVSLIYSTVGRTYIDFLSSGSTVLHFNMSDIKNIPVLLPSIEEQQEIVKYLEEHSSRIHQIITIKQNQIEKLNEYKTTLINAAVTGKIKVV